MQICRVEDLTVEGTITGSVIHFHWVRDIFVQLSGAISASGLGMHLSLNYFVLAWQVQVVFSKIVNIPAASSQLKVEHVTLLIDNRKFSTIASILWSFPLFYTWLCAGCTGGVGRGRIFANGLGAGGGHGGKGGDGYYNGTFIDGGAVYGDPDLPCELGSGSGNGSLAGETAGGGIIGKIVILVLYIFF